MSRSLLYCGTEEEEEREDKEVEDKRRNEKDAHFKERSARQLRFLLSTFLSSSPRSPTRAGGKERHRRRESARKGRRGKRGKQRKEMIAEKQHLCTKSLQGERSKSLEKEPNRVKTRRAPRLLPREGRLDEEEEEKRLSIVSSFFLSWRVKCRIPSQLPPSRRNKNASIDRVERAFSLFSHANTKKRLERFRDHHGRTTRAQYRRVGRA